MKKLSAFASAVSYFLFTQAVWAAEENSNIINITRPTIKQEGKDVPVGYATVNDFIANVLTLTFIIAVLAVLLMLIWGAFEWITSGGEKEAVGKARNKILNALIGLAVLAVAFAIFQLAASFLGFSLTNLTIPSPSR